MTRTEQRLLDAMRAKTSAVRDDALRPLTGPLRHQGKVMAAAFRTRHNWRSFGLISIIAGA